MFCKRSITDFNCECFKRQSFPSVKTPLLNKNQRMYNNRRGTHSPICRENFYLNLQVDIIRKTRHKAVDQFKCVKNIDISTKVTCDEL